jgi:hypothetical protein
VHHLHGARRIAGVALLLSLCACSGGGSSDENSRQIQLSTQSISFSAASPTAAAPEPQIVTATLGQGAANLALTFSGRGIESVTSTVSGNTAQIAIKPAAPSTLGGGIFTTTIAATGYFCADSACSRLEAGASQTMQVSYQVSPVVSRVAPSVAIAGVADQVVIRGQGFSGYATGTVKFGDVAATSVTAISDTELHANYPALAAGTYPVTVEIAAHQGAVPSSASLLAVDPVTFAVQAVAWPDTVTTVRNVIYDMRHGALWVATDANGGELLRYSYNAGTLGAPSVLPIASLRDFALNTDASQLLAISTTQLIPVDPVALTVGTAIDAPTLAEGATLNHIVYGNADRATITAAQGAAATALYDYNATTNTLSKLSGTLINGTPGASGNGAIFVFTQGDPSLTTAPPVFVGDSSTGAFNPTSIVLNQNAVPPTLDRNVTRLILAGQNVYDPTFKLLGTLPNTTAAIAISPDGKRAYTYDGTAGTVLVFDISATNNGGVYPQSTAVTLPGSPGSNVRMTISLDGKTLFIAGSTQLIVQPVP